MTEPQAALQQAESITPQPKLINFKYRKSAESSQVIGGYIAKADT